MSSLQLKESLKAKFENGEFAETDMPSFFDVFSHLSNEVEDIQDVAKGWNSIVEFELTNAGSFWIQIRDGKFSNGTGNNPEASLRLNLSAATAVQIFVGEKDAEALLNSGELKVTGDFPDAVRFYEILELVLEEIEN
jgi:hypothetical protein